MIDYFVVVVFIYLALIMKNSKLTQNLSTSKICQYIKHKYYSILQSMQKTMLMRCEGCTAKKSENINDKILAATFHILYILWNAFDNINQKEKVLYMCNMAQLMLLLEL